MDQGVCQLLLKGASGGGRRASGEGRRTSVCMCETLYVFVRVCVSEGALDKKRKATMLLRPRQRLVVVLHAASAVAVAAVAAVLQQMPSETVAPRLASLVYFFGSTGSPSFKREGGPIMSFRCATNAMLENFST